MKNSIGLLLILMILIKVTGIVPCIDDKYVCKCNVFIF